MDCFLLHSLLQVMTAMVWQPARRLALAAPAPPRVRRQKTMMMTTIVLMMLIALMTMTTRPARKQR
jgi:hypothetical protein